MTTGSPAPQRGEIWYVFTPGQPDDPHQPRPGLVISENVRNRRTDDLIIVPIFSAGRPGPTRLAIPAGMGGLPRDSMLFCEELATIDRDFLVRGPLGPLVPAAMLDWVVTAIFIAVGGHS
jgi:mRNA-degrading endonuclease toxin of MazEF toxin-antitoxin module